MFKLIVKCRKANVTHMLLPSVFVAVHEEKRKEAAQHKHKEREGLEYNRRAVFENRRESLHICCRGFAILVFTLWQNVCIISVLFCTKTK